MGVVLLTRISYNYWERSHTEVTMNRLTIIDVAKEAGLSKSTVSRVIRGGGQSVSPQTRQRVLDAIQKLGYEHNALASSLRTNKTHTVLFIIPDIVNPFWPEVARGVQDALRSEGFVMVLASSDWEQKNEVEYLKTAVKHRFDGILINPSGISPRLLQQTGIPVVLLGLNDHYPGFDSVGNDTLEGVRLALDYLYELGHRRIALINGQYHSGGHSSRLEQYLQFMKEKGLPDNPDWTVNCFYGQEYGYQATKQLLSKPVPPSAIFASNDILAIGALKAITDQGYRLPKDISLIGMDDIYPVSITTPPLTTIAKCKYEEGWQAAQLLLQRISGRSFATPRRLSFPPRLVIRESVGKP